MCIELPDETLNSGPSTFGTGTEIVEVLPSANNLTSGPLETYPAGLQRKSKSSGSGILSLGHSALTASFQVLQARICSFQGWSYLGVRPPSPKPSHHPDLDKQIVQSQPRRVIRFVGATSAHRALVPHHGVVADSASDSDGEAEGNSDADDDDDDDKEGDEGSGDSCDDNDDGGDDDGDTSDDCFDAYVHSQPDLRRMLFEGPMDNTSPTATDSSTSPGPLPLRVFSVPCFASELTDFLPPQPKLQKRQPGAAGPAAHHPALATTAKHTPLPLFLQPANTVVSEDEDASPSPASSQPLPLLPSTQPKLDSISTPVPFGTTPHGGSAVPKNLSVKTKSVSPRRLLLTPTSAMSSLATSPTMPSEKTANLVVSFPDHNPESSSGSPPLGIISRTNTGGSGSSTSPRLRTAPKTSPEAAEEELVWLPETVKCGICCEQGTRRTNEDMAFALEIFETPPPPHSPHAALTLEASIVLSCPPPFSRAACFGVFDGHGGVEAAEHMSRNLPGLISSRCSHIKAQGAEEVTSIMLTLEAQLQERFNVEWNGTDRDPGTTALVATIIDDTLLVANVGDSRLILVREAIDAQGNRIAYVAQATKDHTCGKNEGEHQRVKEAGGHVDEDGYVGSLIEVTRSVGDFRTKGELGAGVIIPDPEVTSLKLTPDSLFCVAFSDGISSTMDDCSVCNMVAGYLNDRKHLNDPEFAARELCSYAVASKGSSDNCSAVVVVLRNQPPPAPARRKLFSRK